MRIETDEGTHVASLLLGAARCSRRQHDRYSDARLHNATLSSGRGKAMRVGRVAFPKSIFFLLQFRHQSRPETCFLSSRSFA